MNFTIGVPPASGIYEIRGVKDGVIFEPCCDFEKVSNIVNWTVTPEGAWFRTEFDFNVELQDWVLVNLEAAEKPDQDIWTTNLIPLDCKLVAYRKYDC